jgi:hypothetical protein
MKGLSATAVGIAAAATIYSAPALANGAPGNASHLGDVLLGVHTQLQNTYNADEEQREADIQKKAAALKEKHKTAAEKIHELKEAKLAQDRANKFKAAYTDHKPTRDEKGGGKKAENNPGSNIPKSQGWLVTAISSLCDLANSGAPTCRGGGPQNETPSWLLSDALGESDTFLSVQNSGFGPGFDSDDHGDKGFNEDDHNKGGGRTPPVYIPPQFNFDWGYSGSSSHSDNRHDDDEGEGSRDGNDADDKGDHKGGHDESGDKEDKDGVGGLTGGPCPPPSHSPVPEPATWAMMIVGLASLGGMVRRRRTVSA